MNMRLLLLSGCLLLSLFLSAQDTIIVQTLTWEDDARSGTYQFPDDPNQTYEKIIMRYNMRCHDAAVGNGNVGCREWDYSCNTFITDPTRQDSIKRTHPNYIIPGFDGALFEYSDTPVEYYQQYTQYETGTISPAPFFRQLGAENLPWIIGASDQSGRHQYLYTAQELLDAGLNAGPINALQLDVTAIGTGELPFFRIKMKHTPLDSLDGLQRELSDFQEVYFHNTPFETTGWQTLGFYDAFEWDGSSNLLVDLSYEADGVAPNITFAGSSTDNFVAAASIDPDQYYLGLNGSGWGEVPNSALGMEQEVTVAFWSYGLPGAHSTNTTVFEATDAQNRRQMNVHLPWSNGQIYWDCGNDGAGYDRINKAIDVNLVENRWTHWAFTKNATTGEMAIYLDGELWHSGSGLYKTIDNATMMNIGRSVNNAFFHAGRLDNFSMWQKALTQEEIQLLMYTENLNQHPASTSMILHYPFNEASGNLANDQSGYNHHATLYGPNWQAFSGEELQAGWYAATLGRINVQFGQGSGTALTEEITLVDTLLTPPSTVISFSVDGQNNLVQTGVTEAYPGGFTYLYDEDGNTLDIFDAPVDGELVISDLTYFEKRAAKFELLSLVTPYGNGLDLGEAGKTFYFDVTDFAPILKGERFLSMEMGGENQEEMDIQFWFIEGTPARDVLDITNVWAFGRGWFNDIQQNNVFEPRMVDLLPEGDSYKLKASITGHGQNGEFVSRNHYLNLNGGPQEFTFDVWKECSENPIYPQGGTWLFDRAGWCPGEAPDVQEYYLPEGLGSSVEIDYGVNGAPMSEANYLVASQLVTYGAPNYTRDAAIEAIIRPSNRVEFERFNPACDAPVIVVKNNGTDAITSLEISYSVNGGTPQTYSWSGNIDFLASAEIELPTPNHQFLLVDEDGGEGTFFVELNSINGQGDENANNNVGQSTFRSARVFDEEQLLIQVKTNNRPQENRYTIRNAAGNVVMSRDNMTANTTYKDDINLSPGCYTFRFEDDGDDGLYYWFYQATGQNIGSGNLSIRRKINETLSIAVVPFEPEFGRFIQFDFVIPGIVNSSEIEQYRRFSIYPNPASEVAMLDLVGFDSERLQYQIMTINGQVLKTGTFTAFGENHLEHISLKNFAAGMYYVRVVGAQRTYVQEIIVE